LVVALFLTGCHTSKPDTRFADLPDLTPSSATSTQPPQAAPASTAAVPSTPSAGSATAPLTTVSTAASSPETLKVGDSLVIAYSDLPELKPAFNGQIRQDGTITLILDQTFAAAGKTPGELEREIRERYVPNFYTRMTVTVMHEGATRFYYVDGEVKMPGRQQYTGPITLTRAISTCGDFTDFARKSKVQLIREGSKKAEKFNYRKLLRDPSLDPLIYPGDKIHVPRRFL